MKLYANRISLTLIICFLTQATFAFNTNSAYIPLYSQKTEIMIKDGEPMTRTKYEIVFKFNDEKAITLYHNYAIYYSYFDEIEHLEAYTKNPTGNGKFKTIDVKDFEPHSSGGGDVFYDDQKEININFLGLTVGSEAHVEYTVATKEVHFTDPMTFRYYLPIELVHYELTVPEEVKVSFIEKNIPTNFYTFNKVVKRNETNYTWIANNVEEEKPYDSPPSRLYFTPHVMYKIDEYTSKGKTHTVSQTPKDLFLWYVDNIKLVNSKPSARIQAVADSITKGATSEREKIKRIYNWVQHNVRYVAFEAGMEGIVPREAEAICNKRYGDCKDMSSLQFALLRAVGIPAYLTWIGTRKIPYTYTELPLKNTDNHMIATVKLDGEYVFLDATDPNGIFGLPSDHIQGKQAMLYKSDTEYELVMVPVIKGKENALIETCEFNIHNNDVEIKTTSNYKGLYAGNLANHLLYLTENEKEDFAKGICKSVSNNAMLVHYTIDNKMANDKMEIALQYTIQDYLKEVDKEKYINVYLDRSFQNDDIKEENRTAPYAFKINTNNTSTYILNIPENYKVTYIPENVEIKQAHFGVSIHYKQENGKLVCEHNVYTEFPDLLLHTEEFPAWNQYVKALHNAYKESIILEKIK